MAQGGRAAGPAWPTLPPPKADSRGWGVWQWERGTGILCLARGAWSPVPFSSFLLLCWLFSGL